jgi:hypothetical protein
MMKQNQSEGNWCCGVCGKDSGISTMENLPEDFEVAFFLDEDAKPIPVLVCKECNQKDK